MKRGAWLAVLASISAASLCQADETSYQIPLKSGAIVPERAATGAGTASAPTEISRVPLPLALSAETEAGNTAASTLDFETEQAEEAARVILQFDELPSQQEVEALRQRGIELFEYLGGNSYYATVQPGVEEFGTGADAIREVFPLGAEHKLHPDLETHPPSFDPSPSAEAGPVVLTVRVEIWQNTDFAAAMETLREHAVTVTEERPSFRSATVEVPESNLEALADLPFVKFISPAPPPREEFNDGVRQRIGSTPLYRAPYGLDGSGTRVGIWDGGRVADSHEDFQGRLTVVDSHAAASTHATHVAGTMAGSGARSATTPALESVEEMLLLSEQRVAETPATAAEASTAASEPCNCPPAEDEPVDQPRRWMGVAPGAHIYSFYWDRSDEEHEQAIGTNNIQVSQNSWGFGVKEWRRNCSTYGDYTDDSAAYDAIVTGLFGRRIPVVFAAGNERNDGDCGMSDLPPYENYANIPPPVTAKNVIAVGAINSDDGSMTAFSSWGPDDAGRIKPDVVAPGCEKTNDGSVTSTVPPNKYGGDCGTSMAAPAVSGCVLLLLQQFSAMGASDPLPSSLKALLIHGAHDWGAPGPDFRSGFGEVACVASVDLVRDNALTEDTIEDHGTSRIARFPVTAGTGKVKVTLAWDDAAGSPASTVPLVNDLDLELRSPSGAVFLPLRPDGGNPELPAAAGVDRINVVEQVVVDAPEAGEWTIRIRGESIAKPPQPFSIVLTRG